MSIRLFHVHHEPQAHAFRCPCALDLSAAQRLSLGTGATVRAPLSPSLKGIIPKVHKVTGAFIHCKNLNDVPVAVTGPVPDTSALRVAKPRGVCPDEI